jgi:flavin reductase (DIM6/NTAB) family NADH-FMN oxidoreductase RutF
MQVAIGCCRSAARQGGFKDSIENILETGEFTVNIMSLWFVEAANHTSGNYNRGVNEFEIAGLTQLASELVKPPRVAESAVHMECLMRHSWDVKNGQVCRPRGRAAVCHPILAVVFWCLLQL